MEPERSLGLGHRTLPIRPEAAAVGTLCGDLTIDGVVNVFDAITLLQIIVDLQVADADQEVVGDLNRDLVLNVFDAITLLQIIVGLADVSKCGPLPIDLLATSDSGASDTDNVTNDATPTISVGAEPDSQVLLSVDGEVVAEQPAGADGLVVFTTALLLDGSRTFTAAAKNTDGATVGKTKPLEVVVDTEPPFTVFGLDDGTTVFRSELTLAGAVFDVISGADAFVCDGVSLVLTDGTFTCELTLSSGANPIVTEATDVAGNVGIQTIEIILDIVPAPPVLDPHVTMTNILSVTITGTASGVAVEVSGPVDVVQVPVSGGAFIVDVELSPNRVNDVFFTTISDTGQRSAPAATAITHDGQPPSLFVDFPLDGTEVTTPTVDVGGRVSDMLSGFMGLTVTVNGAEAAVDVGIGTNGTYLALGVALAVGVPTPITVVATDELGNSATKDITVTRVEPPPDEPNLAPVSGNGQIGQVETQLTDPIVVQLTQPDGSPFADQVVTFQVVRSNGLLTADGTGEGSMTLEVNTDASGLAEVFWNLGSDSGAGNNRVEVTAGGVAVRVHLCASATPAPAAQINIGSGNNQQGEAGERVPDPLRVWVNDGQNGVANIPVTFTVMQGGGSVDGLAAVTVNSDLTGHAEVSFTLGEEGGSNAVEATFAGNAGLPATFFAAGVVREPAVPTTFSAIVLDNANQPVQGATCTLVVAGVALPSTSSDINGLCQFSDIEGSGPAGFSADGLTAFHLSGESGQDIPLGSFPALHYETAVVPNAANSLGTPVLLPPLNPNNAQVYDGTADVELTVDEIEGLKMIVRAGSMTRADGTVPTPQDPAVISLNSVHFDEIPMPMPDGAAPPFAWTLQPAGATFDPPVEIVLPNMSGLAPGSAMYFLSFNHGTNQFEIVATGAVSEDGALLVTDPGSGISVSGWGGFCPPYPNTGGASNEDEDSPSCVAAKLALAAAQNRLQSAKDELDTKVLALGVGLATAAALAETGLAAVAAGIVAATAIEVKGECRRAGLNDSECVELLFKRTSENAATAAQKEQLRQLALKLKGRALGKVLKKVSVLAELLDWAFVLDRHFTARENVTEAKSAADSICGGSSGQAAARGSSAQQAEPPIKLVTMQGLSSHLMVTRLLVLDGAADDVLTSAAQGRVLLDEALPLLSQFDADFAGILDALELLPDAILDAIDNNVFSTDPSLLPAITVLASDSNLPGRLTALGLALDGVLPGLSDQFVVLSDKVGRIDRLTSDLQDVTIFKDFVVTAGNQTAPIAEDGTFTLNNIPSNQGLMRLRIQVPGLGTVARSPFFQPINGQTAIINLFEIIEPPELATVSVQASPDKQTLTSVQPGDPNSMTQVHVSARLSDGTDLDVTARVDGTTYTSSNPGIATVDENGLVTAMARGIVVVTATNEGATATTIIVVSVVDPLTTVKGLVQLGDGSPVEGADVSIVGQVMSTISAADGTFTFSGVPTFEGDISVTAEATVGGTILRGTSAAVPPVRGGTTDVGQIVVAEAVFERDLGVPLNLSDDESALLPLPFDFPFFGTTSRSVFVNSNGNLTFEVASPLDWTEDRDEFTSGSRNRDGITNVGPTIAPFWDDLNPGVSQPGEVDFYSFAGNAGDAMAAEINARRVGSDLDSILTLFDGAGNLIASNDDFFVRDSRIEVQLPTTGTFFLQVVDFGGVGGPSFFYTLTLEGNEAPLIDVGQEIEPNDTLATATAIGFGNIISGTISARDAVIDVFVNDQLPGRFVVTWNNLPEYQNVGSNTIQATLFADGRIQFAYMGVTSDDAIVGLSPSTGDFIEVDYSADTPLSTVGPVAIFEEFDGPIGPDGTGEDPPGTTPFDLDDRIVRFVPNADGGYDVSLSNLGALVGEARISYTGTVEGAVVTEAGAPGAGMEVVITSSGDPVYEWRGTVYADGTFTVPGVPLGGINFVAYQNGAVIGRAAGILSAQGDTIKLKIKPVSPQPKQ